MGASSKNMKGSYDNQMKAFRARKKELLRSIRVAKMARKAARRVLKKKAKRVLKKKAKKSSKKLKSAKEVKKVSPKSGKKKVKSAKKAKVAQKKGKKGVARKIKGFTSINGLSSLSLNGIYIDGTLKKK